MTRRSSCVLLCLAGLLLSPPPAAAGVPAAGVPADPFIARFREELNVAEDRMLHGFTAFETIPFTRPRGWELLDSPEVHLRFSHSAALQAETSSITVLVNDRAVGSVRLTPENIESGELVARVPVELLADENRLGVVVDQHVGDPCESPFDPSLWTRVSTSSHIAFPRRELPVRPELLEFPFPFFDPLGYGPLRLGLVTSGQLSDPTLAAAGELAYALGRIADVRGLEMTLPVPALAEATTPTILIGTPDENPAIAALIDLGDISGAQGLVAIVPNPARPHLPVLVVTGRTPEGVRTAARALTRPDRASFLSGAQTVVDSAEEAALPPTRRTNVMGARTTVTLADLGMSDHTATGFYAAPLVVPVLLEGDAHPHPGGGELRLRYSYSAGIDPLLSTMEVRVANVGIRSVPLDNPDGEERAEVSVKIPPGAITARTDLQIVLNLFPRDFDACARAFVDRPLWGTVFADSTLTLPRDHYASLPDLGLLRHRGWPFSAEADGESVSIVIGDAPVTAEVAAGMQMAADLGIWSADETPSIRLSTSAGATSAGATSAGAISAGAGDGYRVVLATWDSPHTLYRTLEESSAMSTTGTHIRRVLSDGAALLSAHTGSRYATVEELQPSSEPGRTILVLRAPDTRMLLDLTRDLGSQEALEGLSGSLAVHTPDGAFRGVSTHAPVAVVRGTRLSQVRLGLQQNTTIVTLLAMPFVLGMAALIGRWARRLGGTTG